MARTRGTYAVRPWVIYESRDPLRADHERADVDGVILETPYERVRYNAYLDALQGKALDAREIARLGDDARSMLGVLVYAHGKDEQDRRFLANFRRATLHTAGRTFEPRSIVRFGPSEDFYDVGSFREARFTGSVTFRFDEPACAGPATAYFEDAYGRRYRIDFDARRFP